MPRIMVVCGSGDWDVKERTFGERASLSRAEVAIVARVHSIRGFGNPFRPEEIPLDRKYRRTNSFFAWSQEMSTQPAKPRNVEKTPEKKTDATALLTPEELRAISGGASGTTGTGGGSTGSGGVSPKTTPGG